MRGFGGANKEANARLDAAAAAKGRMTGEQSRAIFWLVFWAVAAVTLAIVAWPWGALAVLALIAFLIPVVVKVHSDNRKWKRWREENGYLIINGQLVHESQLKAHHE